MGKNHLAVALVLGGSMCVAGCDARGEASGRRDSGSTLLLFDGGRPSSFGDDGGLFFDEDARVRFGRGFGDPVSAATSPAAISGGTLLAAPTGTLVYASDPDEDRLVIVDTASATKLGEVQLTAGDEPGRLVLDAAGRLHVALRRGGAVVTIDVSTPTTPTITARRDVCGAPRGLAYDADADALHVACNGGELVTLPASGGATTRTLMLPDDLRDVVVDGANLLVTRFRSAQILVVDRASGTVSSTVLLPDSTGMRMPASAGVAWRAISRPGGGALVLHQRATIGEIDVNAPSAYGGGMGCDGAVVTSAVTPIVLGATTIETPSLGCTPLAVDVALSPDGASVLLAAAGAYPTDTQQFRVFPANEILQPSPGVPATDGTGFHTMLPGRIIAVAYDSAGTIIVQTRAPASITTIRVETMPITTPIMLGGADHRDTGLDVFHSNVGVGLACASCHPENGDDGHVWNFLGIGARRTIPVRGGVSQTAPYHWDGEFLDMTSLMGDVFARRMGGGSLDADYQAAMVHWLDAQPQLPARAIADIDAVNRGHDLFDSPDVNCTMCHSGDLASDEMTVDVGTGGAFQVPSLHGVVDRAPYLHDGRAATLEDRFGPTGGGDHHGTTSILTPAQVADLVAYLRTL